MRFTHTIYAGILSVADYYPHIPEDELLYTLFTLTFTKNMQLVEKKIESTLLTDNFKLVVPNWHTQNWPMGINSIVSTYCELQNGQWIGLIHQKD